MDSGLAPLARPGMTILSWAPNSSSYLQPPGKIDNRRHRRLQRFAMRGVTDSFQDHGFHRTVALLLGDFDLSQRAILVVLALNDEDGHPNIRELLREIPPAKLRIKPWPAPTAERVVGIAVPLAKLRAQVGGVVGLTHARDLRDAELLGEEVGRHQHQATDPMVLHAAGVEGGDRCAVAVAKQNAAAESDGVEHA